MDKFLNDYCMSAAITPQSLEVQLSGQTSSTCGPMVTVHARLVSFLLMKAVIAIHASIQFNTVCCVVHVCMKDNHR